MAVSLGLEEVPHLTLLHSEWSKVYGVLTILSAVGLNGHL